jgi:hypothetical protein
MWTKEITIEARTEEEALELAEEIMDDYLPEPEEEDKTYIPGMSAPTATIIRDV